MPNGEHFDWKTRVFNVSISCIRSVSVGYRERSGANLRQGFAITSSKIQRSTTIKFPNLHGLNIYPNDTELLALLNSGNDRWKTGAWAQAKDVQVALIRGKEDDHFEGLRDIAQCISDGFRALGYTSEVVENQLSDNKLNFIIGWHLLGERIRSIPSNSIIYNLEQLNISNNDILADLLVYLSNHLEIWDYNNKNIDFLLKKGIKRIPRLLRVGTSLSMQRIAKCERQDIDVLFYGSLNERRAKIIDQLKRMGLNVVHLWDVYGEERDSYIARSKVVLNMHFYKTNIFEIVRVSYLMANSKAVVTECNDSTEIDVGLLNGVKAVGYDKLVQACHELIQDENARVKLEENANKTINSFRQEDAIFDAMLPCNPAISVIVPTHNRPHLLARALESIGNQTYNDYEIIVVQDGGESVAEVVSKARSNGLPVRLFIHSESKGLSGARNTALRNSRGKWIAYLDDDNLFLPGHLQTLLQKLEEKDAQIAYTRSYTVSEAFEGGHWVEKSRNIYQSGIFETDSFLKTNITPVLNVMHARFCWEVVGEFDESLPLLEDWDYWIRLSRYWNFVYVPTITAEIRVREDRPDNLTQLNALQFVPTRQLIKNKHALKDYQEALLLLPETVPNWKSYVVAFLLSGLPTKFVYLMILLKPESPGSVTEDEVKGVVLDVVSRAGFVRFPSIWILSSHDDLMDALSIFTALYPLGPQTRPVEGGDTLKRFKASQKRFAPPSP
jgi:glycosyltransferase involved in cell wall biosynthesis